MKASPESQMILVRNPRNAATSALRISFVPERGVRPYHLVRYKDLRTETLKTIKHIHSTLGIPAGKRELARVVENRSLENIPEEKGEDTIRRKATLRGWSKDLTPERLEIVEREAAQILDFMPKASVLFSNWTPPTPFVQLQARWLVTRIAQGRKHDP